MAVETQANEPGFVLAPCPFCGGPSHSTPEVGELAALVMCSENDCCTISGATLQAAAAAWNRRAAAPIVSAPAYGVKEALEPFVAALDDVSIGTPDTVALWEHPSALDITVGDLRRARTAYDAIGSGVKAERKGHTPSDEEMDEATIRQRDIAEDAADKLAEAIGELLGVNVGEHSSAHNPWETALEHVGQAVRNRALSTHTAAGAGPVEEADAKAGEPGDAETAVAVALQLAMVLEDCEVWVNAAGRSLSARMNGPAMAQTIRDVALFAAPPASTIPSEPEAKGEAGAGPVGEAVAQKLFEAFALPRGNLHGVWAEYGEDGKAMFREVAAHFLASIARPVEEPGEVERLTRERDRATGLWRGASERAEAAEAALAEAWAVFGDRHELSLADEIRALMRRNAQKAADLAKTRKRLEKVEAAARPFADLLQHYTEDADDDLAADGVVPQIGDLRRLAAALSTQESSAALEGDGKEAGK